jgi:hypothetical protein
VIDTVLAKDKDFQAWRSEHQESFVPRPGSRSHRAPRPHEAKPARPEEVTDLALAGVARR